MSKELDPNETIEEIRERIRKGLRKNTQDAFDYDSADDFDERGLVSGSFESCLKTDAELFPDEIEEYTPEERREKIIRDNANKK